MMDINIFLEQGIILMIHKFMEENKKNKKGCKKVFFGKINKKTEEVVETGVLDIETKEKEIRYKKNNK